MKKISKIGLPTLLLLAFLGSTYAFAATSPSTGTAATFGVLSSTYTNTVSGTTINGDLGYTTGPATAPTVTGTTHVANSTYNQAGTAQGSALTALNSQVCTFNFAPGAIDLATDTTHGPVGVYTPGVYCVTGEASVGTAGINLSGSGTYIFRMTGALNTVANSSVTLSSASACDVWWTPGSATTLGANSNFVGTDISPAGITIGNLVNWTGRALAFGGTITTSSDTITTPSCATPIVYPTPYPTPAVVVYPTPYVTPAVIVYPTPYVTPAVAVVIPLLPRTGFGPEVNNIGWNVLLTSVGIMAILLALYTNRRREIK